MASPGFVVESLHNSVSSRKIERREPLMVGRAWGNGRLCRMCDDIGGILLVKESWSGTITWERSMPASLGHFMASWCTSVWSTSKLHKRISSLFSSEYTEPRGATLWKMASRRFFWSEVIVLGNCEVSYFGGGEVRDQTTYNSLAKTEADGA
jgi:hypothetical protein